MIKSKDNKTSGYCRGSYARGRGGSTVKAPEVEL